MQEQNFLRMYRAQRCLPKFDVRYKNVKSCTITYTRTADSPRGNYSDPKPIIRNINISSESSMVTIPCINSNCTKEYFDLHSVIDEMASHDETNKFGVMFCEGKLEKDCEYQCLCKLVYNIKLVYK